MKLNVLSKQPEKTEKPLRCIVRKGWTNYNGFEADYIDFERDMFTIEQANGERIYIQQVITLHATNSDSDYTEAYMTMRQNNPDGDHDESSSIPLDLDWAINLVLEEV